MKNVRLGYQKSSANGNERTTKFCLYFSGTAAVVVFPVNACPSDLRLSQVLTNKT
jgi:hypothetical protein